MNKNVDFWYANVAKTAEQLESEIVACFDVLDQLKGNALEEAVELADAIDAVDLLEVLDGAIDIKYVNDQVLLALKNVGVDVDGAWDEVCDNNDIKFTLSYTEAEQWCFDRNLISKEEDAVEVVGVTIDDKVWWSLRRLSDGKVVKRVDHPRVDLRKFIPKELLA